MTPPSKDWEAQAEDLVNKFFIGGEEDALDQPNMTKFDLAYSIRAALAKAAEEARRETLQDVEVAVNKFVSDGWLISGSGVVIDIIRALPKARASGKEPK